MRSSRFTTVDGFYKTKLGKRFKGPFENPMTIREAALILNIRESMPPEMVAAAHRKLMLLNHPDNGGSTYIATKINEAKSKLLGD